jgi:spore germination protein KB
MTNNRKENISLWQLFILIINFELGSAMVVSLGNEAKQDAWLAILLATVYGVGLVWAYTFLLNREPGKTLYEIIEKAGGKVFSNILTIMYVLYFFYLSARVLRDFGELITSVILPNTPLEIIAWTFMILIIYILYLGLENLGRLNELFTPYLILFIFAITILLIISGEFTLNNIQLPFKDGVTPVAKAIFPQLMGFPFGNMIVFTIIMTYTSKFSFAGKVSMAAVGVSGLLLSFSALLQLGALGAEARMRSNFPLLSAIRNVSIGNFIERLESIVVFILMIGIIGKVSMYFFVSLKGIEHVFRIPYRVYAFPMGMLVAIFSVISSKNFSELMKEGNKILPVLLDLPFQIGIPAIILGLVCWKQRKANHLQGEEGA